VAEAVVQEIRVYKLVLTVDQAAVTVKETDLLLPHRELLDKDLVVVNRLFLVEMEVKAAVEAAVLELLELPLQIMVWVEQAVLE